MIEFSKHWVPHEYQKHAVDFIIEGGCGNLFLAMGLGKTSIVLEAFKRIKEWDNRPLLIICPLRVAHSVWPNELRKWPNFSELSMVVLHGSDKDQLLKTKADIYVINVDGLQWLRARLGAKWPFGMLVLDESTLFKSPTSKRFKLLKEVAPSIPRRWCLTGTPASSSLLGLFAPQYLVDGGQTLGNSVTKYKLSYFTQGFTGYDWKLKDGAADRIAEELEPSTLKLSADDWLELPALIENDVIVELPPEARKMYDDLEKSLFLQLTEGTISAVNAGAALGKAQQIASGAIYLDREEPGRDVFEIHQAKIEAIADAVEEINGAGVIVAFWYHHERARLQKAFPHAPVLGSGVPEREVNRIVSEWNAGKHPVLLAHSASVSFGLNLQGFGEAVIWASLPWSLELYDQLNARLVRQGSDKSHVIVHRIIANNTVDLDIVKALERKDSVQQSLLDAIKSRIKPC